MDGNPRSETESECSEKLKSFGKDVIAWSVLALVFGFAGFIQTWPRPMGELGHFTHDSGVFLLLAAPWGLATGIGFLRPWRWARISMLVFSALLAAFWTLLAVGFLFLPNLGVSGWRLILLKTIGVSLLLVPSAIGVRWLIYFTRDNVRAHFRASRKAPTASA